jgi:GT2 family glycosyltransferase
LVQVVVVWNGSPPLASANGVRDIHLRRNIGIPGGRNAGVPAVEGELLLFLDDDAALSERSMLSQIGAKFADSDTLGALQPRVQDPDGHPSPRRWVPRLVVADATSSSDVCAIWEGCVVLRRSVFDQIGGWPAEFWYMHEGVELAWRVWDRGYRVRYEGGFIVLHPAVPAARHPGGQWFDTRNRVWLARRNLPLPLAAMYLLNWWVITGFRIRSRSALVQAARGVWAGLRTSCGPRRIMRWRTVGRMTRAGRPPIV